MEITGPLGGLKGYNRIDKSDSADKRGKSSKSSVSKGDSVRLSSDAKLFSQGLSAAQSAPDVRQQKVEQLKALVESGDYVPDLKKTAAKLVEEDLDLLI